MDTRPATAMAVRIRLGKVVTVRSFGASGLDPFELQQQRFPLGKLRVGNHVDVFASNGLTGAIEHLRRLAVVQHLERDVAGLLGDAEAITRGLVSVRARSRSISCTFRRSALMNKSAACLLIAAALA